MDSKKPYIKPDTFSGSTSENIDSFLKKYDRAAKINGWTTEDKAQYIVAFLEGPALTFYENSQHNNIDIPKWEELEKTFRTEFEPIAQKDLIRSMLEKRKQLDDEQTIAYINEAESLCRRVDPLMTQTDMVRNIMKGLRPNIARYIGIMENSTINELKNNIRKYENLEFIITGQTYQSPAEIKESIFKEQLNQLTTQFNDKINILNEKIIKQDAENAKIQTQNYTQFLDNDNSRFRNRNNNNLPFYTPPRQSNYSQRKTNNLPQQNFNNPRNNLNYNSRPYFNNFTKPQCEGCLKYGHIKKDCRSNINNQNKYNPVTCQLCNKIGHSAPTCFQYFPNPKN